MKTPHFTIKNKFQKRPELYEDILTKDILGDVCYRLTGRRDFTVTFDNTGYNIGRLAILEYHDVINYVSFSEFKIESRNSFFQSFPSALVKYHQEINPNKKISFYFLKPDSNIETDYFLFMYRLMKTTGTIFLNETDYLTTVSTPFNTVSDIIAQRDLNRGRNSGNASSYVTVDENDTLQIFGKTYGANKYETTLLCLAIYEITPYSMELYEIQEGDLKQLPKDARNVILSLGINIITSDLILERNEFEINDSLRSPTYTYNLLEKLGDKKCAFCGCEVPQIIQGAHIWPVSEIKKDNTLSQDEKLACALDGENGLWLCQNHHKLLDVNILRISENGNVQYKSEINGLNMSFLRNITKQTQLEGSILSDKFTNYLGRRNRNLKESLYCEMV